MKLPLIAKKQIAENTYEITLGLPEGAFAFNAGQYVSVTITALTNTDARGNTRNFSISSSPLTKDFLTFAFRASSSSFKQFLLNAPINTLLDVQGPFGIFTLPSGAAKPFVFIAGGIGIAPFLSMIRCVTEKKMPYNITLLYVNNSLENAAYLPELEALVKQNNRFVLKNKFGALDAQFIQQNILESAIARWYIAGPSGIVLASRDILTQMRVSKENIVTEEFSGYDVEKRSGLDDLRGERILLALNDLALVSTTDLEGAITYANDKFIKTSQYSREELMGQNHRILKSGFHPQSFYNSMWREYLLKGKVWRGEIKNKKKDGTFYWVDANIAPIFGHDGIKVGYIGIRLLITQQKENEEKLMEQNVALTETKSAMLNILEDARTLEAILKEERNLSQTIISSMAEGVCVVDKEYKLLVINKAAEKLFGFYANEVLGQDLSKLVLVFKDGKEMSLGERPIWKTLKESKALYYGLGDNISFATAAKNQFFIELSTAPLLGNGVIGVVAVFRDINEEKKLDESKTNFISVTSHQLRTPITAIRWFTEMLISGDAGKLNNNQSGFADQIYKGVLRLTETINMILALARLESGRVKIEPAEIDLVKFSESILHELKPLIDEKKLNVRLLTDEKIPKINLDPSVFRQVILNLISNSVRYTNDKGHIEIALKLDGKNQEIIYSVRDDGIGIPENQKTRIFEKFFRADNALAKVPEGNGLGLNLVKTIIELWKGKIWFESGQGKGVTFYFTIPFEGMQKP